MTKRTRLFLLVSGGILVVGLGTGLVAAYVGGFQNLSLLPSSAPSELVYLPADTKVVAFANVHDILNSELHQRLKSTQSRSGEGLARFEAETGVDVTRDVDYVLAAIGNGAAAGGATGADAQTGGGPAAAAHQGPPLILVRGRFDATRLEGLARSKGGEVQDYKGTRVVSYAEPSGDMSAAVAFLEPGLLAMGGFPAVRAAIDTHASRGANVTDNKELMRLLKDADDGNAWAVARFDALTSAGRLPSDVTKRLPPINWLTVTGHVNGGLRASLKAEARDDAAAKDLRDVVQGMLALARMQTGQRPEVASVLNSIELGGDGRNVSLAFTLPVEAIDLLAGLHQQRPGRTTPAPATPETPPVTAP
jgi:hypothetical protein